VERFLDAFEMFMAVNSVKGFSDFVYPENRRPNSTKHLQTLIDAIRKKRLIQFYYIKFSNRSKDFLVTQHECVFESLESDVGGFYIVEPYALKEFRGLWYLIAKDNKDKKYKTFGLDRISDVKDMGSFTKEDSLNVAQKYHDCFGIYIPHKEYKPEEVILSFDAENGRYLKANPLHHSQKILIDNENEFKISLYLYITLDFLQEILTRTWSLKVIEPESLREKACKIWKEALKRNG
jgi:predicted DNA-binding transcriptional regulator YafY